VRMECCSLSLDLVSSEKDRQGEGVTFGFLRYCAPCSTHPRMLDSPFLFASRYSIERQDSKRGREYQDLPSRYDLPLKYTL
jgi:hypothetical protein